MAALVNPREGRILSSPNLYELDEQPLAETLSRELSVKVVIENDATAAAIGEHWQGSSKSVENSIFVTLGTGIGGGLILDGRPFRGADGTAGEIGHICVEPEGWECGCGSRGCVEQYASATAIVRTAGELLTRNSSSSLASLPKLTSKDVYSAAMAGDQVGLETYRLMGRKLGLALSDLVDILNPELIVIGGGVAAGWDAFIGHVEAEIKTRAFKHPAETVQLVRASLGNSAGILGAARVILDAV
jgi:glucokinase